MMTIGRPNAGSQVLLEGSYAPPPNTSSSGRLSRVKKVSSTTRLRRGIAAASILTCVILAARVFDIKTRSRPALRGRSNDGLKRGEKPQKTPENRWAVFTYDSDGIALKLDQLDVLEQGETFVIHASGDIEQRRSLVVNDDML